MGPREIIIIALVVVLLFGAPKLPQLARAIGKSMRILKDETKSLTDDDNKADDNRNDDKAGRTSDAVSNSDVTPESTIDASAVDDERRDRR